MSSGKYNTTIEQGAVFNRTLYYKQSNGNAVDLTGFTAEMDIRLTKDAEEVIHTLTTENGGITITPLTGKIVLYISALDTEDFDFEQAYYDLELNPGNPANKKRLIEGILSLSREVTREDES